MKFYIAAHSQEDAKRVASKLVKAGHAIVSTWLHEDFRRTSSYTESDRTAIADKDVAEVLDSDGLVLLASSYRVPGGKFVEVGVAIGAGKPVYILGHRENMLMWSSQIKQFNSVEDMICAVEV